MIPGEKYSPGANIDASAFLLQSQPALKMIKRSLLDRFRDLIIPDDFDDDEEDGYPVENLINVALTAYKKWASPVQCQKLIDSLKTSVYRKSETRLYHNLKLFSKKLGDVPRGILEELMERIEPETIVEKVPATKDNWVIDGISLVNNIDGRIYYEASAHDQADENKKGSLFVYDGEFVSPDFTDGIQFDGSSFAYGESYIAAAVNLKYVVYMDKKGRTYDEISHLIDFDIRKLAYHARTDKDLFIVVEDKKRFGQFDYSVHTGQIIREHTLELSKRGVREIEDVLKRIDPIIYRKTMRLVKQLKLFGTEFLSVQQKTELDQFIKSFHGDN